MRKAAIDPAAKFLLSMILIIAFFILAYVMLFTDTGTQTVDAFNYYVGSKVGIAVSPAKIGKISSTTSLSAKITAEPQSTVCANEPVYFSANSSSLPKDVAWSDAHCFWDFDLASEPCIGVSEPPVGINCAGGSAANNSNTEDDYEATTCDAVYDGPWPSGELTSGDTQQGVKLVMVAGGKTDTDKVLVKSTFTCACAVSSGATPGCAEIVTQPALPAAIANGKILNVSFKDSWNFADVHFVMEPVGQVSNLFIGIGTDRAYVLRGNLTNPTVAYGQNLVHYIEQKRGECRRNAVDPCPVQLSFQFSGPGSIKVKEIWIPLSLGLA